MILQLASRFFTSIVVAGILTTLTINKHVTTAESIDDVSTSATSSSSKDLKGGSSSSNQWAQLDKRALPTWYDEAKFGIFVHWGLFSVPSVHNEWFWYHWQKYQTPALTAFVRQTETPNFAYADYAHRFMAELYDPIRWVNDIFAPAGAQYVVLTTKHHEGYCLWNSTGIPATWNWNVMEVGPRRDVFGELAQAVKKTKSPMTQKYLKLGAYHSLVEWFNPLFLQDQANNFATSHFVDLKTSPEMYDLVERYEPEIFWSDGNWAGPSSYWKATEFLNWYANNSTVGTTAVWNDRWGTDTPCKHGSFVTCQDDWRPGTLVAKKWEQCITLGGSWGLNRNATFGQYMTVRGLVHMLIQTVAFNGNFLLNVAPAADGTIQSIFIDRLLGIGDWLKVNGPAIYATKPWKVCTNETNANVFYTMATPNLYVHMIRWPPGNVLTLECPIIAANNNVTVKMLGLTNQTIDWVRWRQGNGIQITLPQLTPDRIPCQHAWVLVISGVANLIANTNTTTGRASVQKDGRSSNRKKSHPFGWGG